MVIFHREVLARDAPELPLEVSSRPPRHPGDARHSVHAAYVEKIIRV